MNTDKIKVEESEFEGSTLKDYIVLVRNNLWIFFVIVLISIVGATFYAFRLPDIYVSSCSIKITKTGGNILQNQGLSGLSDFGDDRFINNEIEILKSYNLRDKIAKSLIDSVVTSKNIQEYKLIYAKAFGNNYRKLLTVPQLVGLLSNNVTIEQKKGLDVIIIAAESPSPLEATLVAELYAEIYRRFNLEVNRDQLTYLKNFLEKQRAEKKQQLESAEDTLRSYQEKGGMVVLDVQAQSLINLLSEFESRMNATKIDLTASEGMLTQYKQELAKQDPKLASYLESQTSESYIRALQNQIAELQLNKDLALVKSEGNIDISGKVKEYDTKIQELQSKLDDKVKILKTGILASSPEEVRALSQKIIEKEVQNQSYRNSLNSLTNIVKQYDEKFNKLPKTTLDLARFKRTRESTEKLFTLIEQKYQEAVINEESQPGNVLIIDDARVPGSPSKPNRLLIVMTGLLIGLALGLAFVFIKNYFDDTVKTPEEIEKRHANVLAWIPKVDELNGKSANGADFIIERFPSSIASESIRALRTRVQFSKNNKETFKIILITSPAPQEGKTTIALNLAGSFAHSKKKTLLIDADLRKPRLHQVFKRDKEPGLINYLTEKFPYEKLIIPTSTENLFLITSGSISQNPSEILDSLEMDELLRKARNEFDYIIIDSPPIVAVTDAEILATKSDGTILVVSHNKTEADLLERGVQLIRADQSHFIGTVLNNFSSKQGYGSYYKYYYYYSSEGEKKYRKKKHSKDVHS